MFFKLSYMKHTGLHGAGKSYIIFFFQTFFLAERKSRESREASVGLTETPHGDRVSERGEDGKAAGITWGGGGC